MAKIDIIHAQRNQIPIESIYVFGQRNSGTNYVNSLIMRNCVVSDNLRAPFNPDNQKIFGWKHGFPAMIAAPDNVLSIVVYRDPITWLDSLCRAPWHTAPHLRNIAFSQFIRSEWHSIVDDAGFGIPMNDARWGKELMADRDPLTGKRFANAMRMRNAKNVGFATLDHRCENVLRVRYESVVQNPDGFLNALCATYGLLRHRRLRPVLHDRGTPSRGVFVPRAAPQISDADRAYIARELDLGMERSLGYDLADALLHQAA
jgi:hypothetical protein